MSVWKFPESLSQRILVGIFLVGRLGVEEQKRRDKPSELAGKYVIDVDLRAVFVSLVCLLAVFRASGKSALCNCRAASLPGEDLPSIQYNSNVTLLNSTC